MRDLNYVPESPKELCGRLLYTAYLATENSSEETKDRSQRIAENFGCFHRVVNFDHIYKSYQNISRQSMGLDIKYMRDGGSERADLALQNAQARTRMVLSYFLSVVEPEKRDQVGYLLVLGTSTLDDSLRGDFTKYDCSSADLNPIASFSKYRLREIVSYFQQMHGFAVLEEVLKVTPTA